ncbi:MAG: TlpA disulfide reductase family protein [Acidimicrobiales bacterium]
MEPTDKRSWAARAGLAAVAVAAVAWLAISSLTPADLPNYGGAGTPISLPDAGRITAADAESFAQVLAGQRGRPVVVNVWASWCAPCRAEMPLLQAAADEYEAEVTFLGVASNDQVADAEQFMVDVGVGYPNVFDTDGSIARAFAVSAYPSTFVFDRDGVITARVDGGISEQRLAGLVAEALG